MYYYKRLPIGISMIIEQKEISLKFIQHTAKLSNFSPKNTLYFKKYVTISSDLQIRSSSKTSTVWN